MTANTIKRWLPAAVWAGLILLASSDIFSAAHTRGIIESFFRWLFPTWSPYSVYKAHLIVRKCAHFFEYAVLAILVMRGFEASADKASNRDVISPAKWNALRVILLCAMVATVDEVHQHFVPSRTSSPYDVMLDTTGSTVALLLLTWKKSSRAEQRTA